MQPKSDKGLIERILDWWRGMMGQPKAGQGSDSPFGSGSVRSGAEKASGNVGTSVTQKGSELWGKATDEVAQAGDSIRGSVDDATDSLSGKVNDLTSRGSGLGSTLSTSTADDTANAADDISGNVSDVVPGTVEDLSGSSLSSPASGGLAGAFDSAAGGFTGSVRDVGSSATERLSGAVNEPEAAATDTVGRETSESTPAATDVSTADADAGSGDLPDTSDAAFAMADEESVDTEGPLTGNYGGGNLHTGAIGSLRGTDTGASTEPSATDFADASYEDDSGAQSEPVATFDQAGDIDLEPAIVETPSTHTGFDQFGGAPTGEEGSGISDAGVETVGDLGASELGTLEDTETDEGLDTDSINTDSQFGDEQEGLSTESGIDTAASETASGLSDLGVGAYGVGSDADVSASGNLSDVDSAATAAGQITDTDASWISSLESGAETTSDADQAGDESSAASSLDYVGLFGDRSDVEVTDLSYLDDSEAGRYDFSTVDEGETTDTESVGSDADMGESSIGGDEASSGSETEYDSGTAISDAADNFQTSSDDVATAPTFATDLGPADEGAADLWDVDTSQQDASNELTGSVNTAAAEQVTEIENSDQSDLGTGIEDDTSLAALDDDSSSSGIGNADVDSALIDDDQVQSGETSDATDAAAEMDSATPSQVATGPGGSVRGDGSGGCPTDFPIKGNSSSKIYHMPGLPSYRGTKAEWCFATEEDAISAGYRAPGGRAAGGKSISGAGAASASTITDTPRTTGTAANSSVAPETPSGSDAYADSAGLVGEDLGSAEASTTDLTSAAEFSADVPPADTLSYLADTGVAGTSLGDDEGFGSGDDDIESLESASPDDAAAWNVDAASADVAESDVASSGGDSGATSSEANAEPGYAGAVHGDGTKTCPTGYPIKGNASSMIYHTPGRASYDATIPEWCFASEEDAENAGFRAPKR